MQPPTARELDRALREGRSPVSGVAVFGATTVAVLATLPTLGAALRSAKREMLTLAGGEYLHAMVVTERRDRTWMAARPRLTSRKAADPQRGAKVIDCT